MRGEGSLQALLGRDVTKRKRRPDGQANGTRGEGNWRVRPIGQSSAEAAPVPSTHPASSAEQAAGSAAPASSPSGPSGPATVAAVAGGAAAAAHVRTARHTRQAPIPGGSPLKPGYVRCPVCSCQLPNDADRVNAHIDKCLSKGSIQKHTQQASLLQFARRRQPGAAEQQPQAGEQPRGDGAGKRRRSSAGGAALAAGAASAAGELLQSATETMDLTRDGSEAERSPAVPSSNPPSPVAARQPRQQLGQQAEPAPSVSWPSSQGTPSSQEAPATRSPPARAASRAAQGVPLPPAASPSRPAPPGLRCFNTLIMGRQYQKHDTKCQSGQRLSVEWEAGNPRDPNAVLVLDARSRLAMGHLPHRVARHLAPLLRGGQALAEAVVMQEPLGERQPVAVELQVTLLQGSVAAGASPGAAGRAAAALGRAAAAAEEQREVAPQATGERLHRNFLTVLDTVQRYDGHLLAQLETGFIEAYKALPLSAQCLFLRLYQRKGPLFMVAGLSYRDVLDAAAAAAQLAAAGLAATLRAPLRGSRSNPGSDPGQGASWEELAELLTVPELAAVLAARRIKPAPAADRYSAGAAAAAAPRSRPQLLAAAAAHAALGARHGAMLAGWLLDATGEVVRLADGACEAVGRLQRLFFLNEGQSLSQFLASDLGVMQYPRYAVHRSCSAFATRQQLLAYEAALRHATALTEAGEEGDAEAAEAALAHAWEALDAGLHKQARDGHSFLRRCCAGEVYCLMASAGVHALERGKRYHEAVDRLTMLLGGVCCPERRGEWWERLSINLKHLGRHGAALEQAEAALADGSLSVGARLTMQRRVLLLGKPPHRWKAPPWKAEALREPPVVTIHGRPLSRVTGAKSRFFGLDDEQCGVEELALQHYASAEGGGWRGVHSEGGIWATLFGLLLWDVLFAPVPDVFRTPFQTAPLDLNTPLFYETRAEAVEACLARVAAGEGPAMLRTAWEAHHGTLCRGVRWDRHSVDELAAVAACVGGRPLAAVCRLLAQDHGGWSGGMPDLLLWRPERGDAKLAEVKGPRDRLSNQQRAWMAALADAGLRAEVLKVQEPPAGGGKRARAA